MTEAQKRARNKYQKKVKKFTLDFCPTEFELLDHINKQPNKQGYIKKLIRADMTFKKLGEALAKAARTAAEAEVNAATLEIEKHLNSGK